MRLCAPGPHPRAVELVGDGLVEDLVDQRGLARARHAGDRREDAERDLDVDVLEVVLGRALDLHVAARLAPLGRDLDPPRARQELARQRLRHAPRPPPPCRPPRRSRRARPRPGPCRPGGRPRASCPRRARPRARCCRGRAAAPASRSAARCRAGAGRSTARRGCRARRPATSRSASRAGSAAPRRPTASPPRGPSTGSRRRRCPGSAAARRSRAGSAARSRGPASDSSSASSHSSERCALRCVNSWIARSPTLTARDSGRSRAPLHSGHGRTDMYSSIFSRDQSESVSL